MMEPLPKHDDKSNWKGGVPPFTEEQEEGMEDDATIAAVMKESCQLKLIEEATTGRIRCLKEELALNAAEVAELE